MPAGISDNEVSTSVLMFPNPTTNVVNFKFAEGSADKLILKITNTTGQIVKTQEVNTVNGMISVDINSLSKGVYTVSLTGDNTRYVNKLVVK